MWEPSTRAHSWYFLWFLVEVIVHDREIEITAVTQVLDALPQRPLPRRDLDPGHNGGLEGDADEGEPSRIAPDRRVVLAKAPALGVEELDGRRSNSLHVAKHYSEPLCRRWGRQARHAKGHSDLRARADILRAMG
jgi:hypothetical protein